MPDDWADRWQDFHKPLLVGERLWLRPSWEDPREGAIDLVVDPGQAFGTGAHPTTRLCLELLLELADAGEARGPLTDLGTGSGVLAIAAAKLGWSPVRGYDHEQPSIEAAAANAKANSVRDRARAAQPTRRAAGARPDDRRQHDRSDPEGDRRELAGDRGRVRRSNSGVAPSDPPPIPRMLLLSGLLPGELDEIAAAFSPRRAEPRRIADSTAIGPLSCSVG